MLRQLKNVKNAYSELGHLRDKARAAGLEWTGSSNQD